MNAILSMIRFLFVLLTIITLGTFAAAIAQGGITPSALGAVLALALGSGIVFFSIEKTFKETTLYSFNLVLLGLAFGALMGYIVTLVVWSIFDLSHLEIGWEWQVLTNALVYLSSIYLALILVVRSSEEIYLSIPFVRFQAVTEKKRDIVLDASALLDSRTIDLAASGLMDHHLVVPRFMLKEYYTCLEHYDETIKARARRSLEVLKKLEALPALGLRYVEADYPDVTDPLARLVRFCRLSNANILTSEMSRIEQSTVESSEGIRVINLTTLANALKPITNSGESLDIKIQRLGKEQGQGVGYLDDGTMVVVNGAADFIGQTIRTTVLSVKHTSSGRMIFCNAAGLEDSQAASRFFAMDAR